MHHLFGLDDIDGHLNVLGSSVEVTGYEDNLGNYLLAGSANVNFYVGSARADFALRGHLLNATLSVDAGVNVLGSNVAFHVLKRID